MSLPQAFISQCSKKPTCVPQITAHYSLPIQFYLILLHLNPSENVNPHNFEVITFNFVDLKRLGKHICWHSILNNASCPTV